MAYSIKQELYKLAHRKITWISAILLLFLMILTGFAMAEDTKKLVLALTYDSSDFIMFILVIVGATSFSMEFQNNAILTLLYKSANKIEVYLSKYLAIFIYDIFLHVLAIIYTIILRYTIFRSNVNWNSIYLYHQPIWINMLKVSAIDLVSTMLIITIVFLLSCIINNNAVVITVSLLVTFLGQGISSSLTRRHMLVVIMKWNPFNMVNLTRQYGNFITYVEITHLRNPQILLGSIIYIMIFFIIGYLIFRKKRF